MNSLDTFGRLNQLGPTTQHGGHHRPRPSPSTQDGVDRTLTALRGQFDALCVAADVTPRLCSEVDDMAMLRPVARDSGWLTVLPEVVVQDELRASVLVTVRRSAELHLHQVATRTGSGWGCSFSGFGWGLIVASHSPARLLQIYMFEMQLVTA